jgi:carnosine N-methyltransferase
MAAGDFTEIYADASSAGQWDCVMTCFFMDTARNIVEYVEVVKNCLCDGGLWIHLGPLLYHFEGMQNEPSIELSHEELLGVVTAMGFEILEQKDITTSYSSNVRSMLHSSYHAKFFVARKIAAE